MGTIGQSYAATFDVDTIDNWQIYNNGELVLAGHYPSYVAGFKGTIKKANLKKLEIQFNHCVHYDDLDVTIEILDDKEKILLRKTFKINSGTRMTIEKEEMGNFTSKSISIRYVENRKGGTDQILGFIRFD